jgi:hypothetical protein
MRTLQAAGTSDSARARGALLGLLPPGTDKERTLALLRNEGFGCRDIAEPIADTRLRQRFVETRRLSGQSFANPTKKVGVNCQAGTPNVIGYKDWVVDLEFDADARLSDASVAIWNIFL